MSTTQSASQAQAQQSSSTGGDGLQPTVRVMRLYKPALHCTPCLPQLSLDELFNAESAVEMKSNDTEFTVSPFLLLPDSFGDIYMGELFSAYISVVNGVEVPFHQVTLSVRLQTMNATHDLYDARTSPEHSSGFAKVLSPHQSTDMVVQHALSELGTHTLKVSVVYTDTLTSESKSLRKFYRFNVLSPVNILTSCYEMDSKYCIQSQIINTTKSVIHIEDVKLIGLGGASELDITAVPKSLPNDETSLGKTSFDLCNMLSMPLLNPDESFAYSFIVHKATLSCLVDRPLKGIGFVEVHWSSSMGENGRSRSSEISTDQRASFLMPFQSSSSQIKRGSFSLRSVEGSKGGQLVGCLTYIPSDANVGVPLEVKLIVRNCAQHSVKVQLQCRKKSSLSHTGLAIMGKSHINLGSLSSGQETPVSLSLLPLSHGLFSLPDIFLVNLSTKAEYSVGTNFQILVRD